MYSKTFHSVLISSVLTIVMWLNQVVVADVVWIKESGQPVFGRVVSVNASTLVFEQRINSGSYRNTEYQLADIQYHRNLKPELLSQLDGRNWGRYRDLAEELAAQKTDPVARETAIRLYVIAAANDKGEIGLSALTGLMSVARSQVEKEKFERLLALYSDPARSAVFQTRDKPLTQTPQVIDGRNDLLLLVQQLRRGGLSSRDRKDFERKLDEPSVKLGIQSLKQENVRSRLRQIAAITRPTPRELRYLVELESILRFNAESKLKGPRSQDWSDSAFLPASQWSTLPRIDRATEFDPAETLWRDGKWQRPND